MDHDSPRALPRELVDHLDRECARLLQALIDFVGSIPPDQLYRRFSHVSVGENLLRSGAVLEQTFGGLTANLWDDPFEWTLPEALSSAKLVTEYLTEVDAARERAFNSIASDRELTKYVSGPGDKPQQLFALLLETLTKASDYYGRAVAMKNIAINELRQK